MKEKRWNRQNAGVFFLAFCSLRAVSFSSFFFGVSFLFFPLRLDGLVVFFQHFSFYLSLRSGWKKTAEGQTIQRSERPPLFVFY